MEAETLAALMEELDTVEPEQPNPGLALLKAVRTRTWRAARRPPEVAVPDPAVTKALRRDPGDDVEWHISAPIPKEDLLAPSRVIMSRSQREGELLGAMCHRLGLRDRIVALTAARRGPRVAVLPLRTGRPR
ncbi:hypothetical protein AB0K89_11460 [Streptomyces cinnamoneus]|uniref:hypothetical protein n=1 Tax=Streptomyces cinnamoneus TaxID=53446 RepID=UPI003425A542